MKKPIFSPLLVCLAGLLTISQASAEVISVPLNQENADQWEFADADYTFETFLGQDAIVLKQGLVLVKDSEAFVNGTVEFDIIYEKAYDPTIEKAFGGGVFRAQSFSEYEVVHSRDNVFGSRYGLHYFPVYNGKNAVQLYYGPGHNPPQMDAPYGQWVHVKIVVAGDEGEVYVDDMTKPILFINDLKRGQDAGKVGIYGNYQIPITLDAVKISNFSYEITDTAPTLNGTADKETVAFENDPNLVTNWLISNPYTSPATPSLQLSNFFRTQLTWTPLVADKVGIVNISRVNSLEGDKTEAFSRFTINSDSEQVKKLYLGFSDTAQVYLNGTLLAEMKDGFKSRDQSFIGTMGFFDSVYLPLNKGANEVWIASSEVFAGWGVKARFENLDGISLTTSPDSGVDLEAKKSCNVTFSPITGAVHMPCIEVTGDTNLYQADLIRSGDDKSVNFNVDGKSVKIK